MFEKQFRCWITPVDHPRFDWNVTVLRLRDGAALHDLVSGGWAIAQAATDRLMRELDALPQGGGATPQAQNGGES